LRVSVYTPSSAVTIPIALVEKMPELMAA